MPMTAQEIERTILAALPDAKVEIEDLAGDGDHYACAVTSEAFRGLSRVRQHKLVYDAFGTRMGTELHAMALRTITPA
ncbi:BolA-like protein [Neokomagataea thailandica NBRC 106555]|uniref:BolA family transcriptional regulator n=2 Tax=Neokomagataea TaxID=1223423 RepID=A0A4Y6V665_9PROT|nr:MULTISPECIES: BolA family transcriptional regulator [Neokomagataea]QDH25632.1 BolA family transcriptional regulator [Neokomagataea tanensis]GBR49875.1 BolA-like protein [Neokomagataea thailandica NBRC 106555]